MTGLMSTLYAFQQFDGSQRIYYIANGSSAPKQLASLKDVPRDVYWNGFPGREDPQRRKLTPEEIEELPFGVIPIERLRDSW